MSQHLKPLQCCTVVYGNLATGPCRITSMAHCTESGTINRLRISGMCVMHIWSRFGLHGTTFWHRLEHRLFQSRMRRERDWNNEFYVFSRPIMQIFSERLEIMLILLLSAMFVFIFGAGNFLFGRIRNENRRQKPVPDRPCGVDSCHGPHSSRVSTFNTTDARTKRWQHHFWQRFQKILKWKTALSSSGR